MKEQFEAVTCQTAIAKAEWVECQVQLQKESEAVIVRLGTIHERARCIFLETKVTKQLLF